MVLNLASESKQSLSHAATVISPAYSWPFGPISMGARGPAHNSPAQARPEPDYYWAPGGTGPIAGPCLGLNAGPWTRPGTARK